MKTDLERGFDDLLSQDDRQQSGYRFQSWLGDVLRRAGFVVHPNARAARPRQTDIFAGRGGCDFLVEAKFRRAAVTVSDIDSLRSRLERTPGDVIGCLFSLSDYSKTAIAAVEDRRNREILLFNVAEIRDLARSPGLLSELIDKKREQLRVHARVSFARKDSEKALSSEIRLPPSELQIWRDGQIVPCVPCTTDNFDLVFSTEHLDPIGNSDDPEFGVRLDLDVRHLPELHRVLGTLHNHLDLSATGTFAIHQTKVSWHGAGAENFFSAAAAWQSRYQATDLESFHHSEELHYVGEFRYGRLVLTARQRVGETVFLHSAEVELRLAGIPVDREPLRELCSKTGNRDAFLTLYQEKYYDQLHFHSDRLTLEAVGLIHSTRFTGDTAVCGIVAKNPFFRKAAAMKKAGLKAGSPIEHLASVEILCCSLNDWHDVGDIADVYYLTGIQCKWLGQALVIRPMCTWKNITNRPQPSLTPTLVRKTGGPRRRPKPGK
jgi:hypothetical protein